MRIARRSALALAAALAVAGPGLAFALRATTFYRIGVLRFGSLCVAALASWWFIQRAFDLAPS